MTIGMPKKARRSARKIQSDSGRTIRKNTVSRSGSGGPPWVRHRREAYNERDRLRERSNASQACFSQVGHQAFDKEAENHTTATLSFRACRQSKEGKETDR